METIFCGGKRYGVDDETEWWCIRRCSSNVLGLGMDERFWSSHLLHQCRMNTWSHITAIAELASSLCLDSPEAGEPIISWDQPPLRIRRSMLQRVAAWRVGEARHGQPKKHTRLENYQTLSNQQKFAMPGDLKHLLGRALLTVSLSLLIQYDPAEGQREANGTKTENEDLQDERQIEQTESLFKIQPIKRSREDLFAFLPSDTFHRGVSSTAFHLGCT